MTSVVAGSTDSKPNEFGTQETNTTMAHSDR